MAARRRLCSLRHSEAERLLPMFASAATSPEAARYTEGAMAEIAQALQNSH